MWRQSLAYVFYINILLFVLNDMTSFLVCLWVLETQLWAWDKEHVSHY